MPFEELLPGLIGAAIPSIGAQAVAKQQRRWALEDLERQNLYNSPKEQLRRLREAGLPAAAFFSGGVSSQSDQPRDVNIDPTLGLSAGMNNYFTNRIQQAQIKGLEADARLKTANADIAEVDRNWWLTHKDSGLPGLLGAISAPGMPRQIMQESEQRKRLANSATAESIATIQSQIATSNADDILGKLKRGELDHTLKSNKLLNQLFVNNETFLQFKRDFANRLSSKGEGSSVWDILEDLIGMLMMRSNITNKF